MRTGMAKVVVTGDSINDPNIVLTTSYQDPNWKGWVDLLSREIDAPIVNTSSAGEKASTILSNIKTKITNYKPTHVIFNGGINDISAVASPTDSTAKTVYNTIASIAKTLKTNKIKGLFFLCPVVSLTSNQGAMLYTGKTSAQLQSFANAYQKFIDLIKKDLNSAYPDCHVLDLSTTELGTVGNIKTTLYLGDTINPNSNGQMIIAQNIKAKLQELYPDTRFNKEITDAPSGAITTQDGQQLYVKVNDKMFPLFIASKNKKQACCSIKWRC